MSKDILTTGQVAKICQVAPRTVSKWFDTGQLRGYRIPGSKDRRIPVSQLIKFMKRHGMPIAGLDTGQYRVLMIDDEPDLTDLIAKTLGDTGRYQVRVAESAFAAGALTGEFRPHALLVDLDIAGVEGHTLARYLRSHADLQHTQLIAISASLTEADKNLLRQEGWSAAIGKPFTIQQLMAILDDTLSIVQ